MPRPGLWEEVAWGLGGVCGGQSEVLRAGVEVGQGGPRHHLVIDTQPAKWGCQRAAAQEGLSCQPA